MKIVVQLNFPRCELTNAEWESVNNPVVSPALGNTLPAELKRRHSSVAQSVESLTHQMVVNIMGEVTRRASSEQLLTDANVKAAETVEQLENDTIQNCITTR